MMPIDCLVSHLPGLLAAADAHATPAPGDGLPEPGQMFFLLAWTVRLGVFVLCAGMMGCLYRLVRGPELADRVLAADLLALHVVGLVILLTIYLGDMVFFDAALAVSILGFVSTIGFAQYLYATSHRQRPDQQTPQAKEAL